MPVLAALLLEQLFDFGAHEFFTVGALPTQFALPAPAAYAVLVDEINRRPIVVVVALPHGGLVVHRDGEGKIRVLQFLLERVLFRIVLLICDSNSFRSRRCCDILLLFPLFLNIHWAYRMSAK